MIDKTLQLHDRIIELQSLFQRLSDEKDMQSEILAIKENAFERATKRWRISHDALIKAERELDKLQLGLPSTTEPRERLSRIEPSLHNWSGWWKQVSRTIGWHARKISARPLWGMAPERRNTEVTCLSVSSWRRLQNELMNALCTNPWTNFRLSPLRVQSRIHELLEDEKRMADEDQRRLRAAGKQSVASRKAAADNVRAELAVKRTELLEQQVVHAARLQKISARQDACRAEIESCQQQMLKLQALKNGRSKESHDTSSNLSANRKVIRDQSGSRTDLARQSI